MTEKLKCNKCGCTTWYVGETRALLSIPPQFQTEYTCAECGTLIKVTRVSSDTIKPTEVAIKEGDITANVIKYTADAGNSIPFTNANITSDTLGKKENK